MRSSSLAAMPQPSSWTTISIAPVGDDSSTDSDRRPPPGIDRRPLLARFHTICRTWSSSVRYQTGPSGTSTSMRWPGRTSAPFCSSRTCRQRCGPGRRGRASAEAGARRPETIGCLVQPLRLLEDDVHQLGLIAVEGKLGAEHLHRAGHRGQRIADLVGDARRHLSDRRQTLSPARVAFEALDVGDVLKREEMAGAAIRENERRRGDPKVDGPPVGGRIRENPRAGPWNLRPGPAPRETPAAAPARCARRHRARGRRPRP